MLNSIFIGIQTFILLMVSSVVPIFSFLLPVFKITKLKKLDPQGRVIANVIPLAGIVVFSLRGDFGLLYNYVGFLLIIEILYLFFDRSKIEIFDRILISTFVTGAILLVVNRFVGVGEAEHVKLLKDVFVENGNPMGTLPVNEMNKIIEKTVNLVMENQIVISFIIAFVTNYFTYYILKGKTYREWKISYLWLLLFIIVMPLKLFVFTDNVYLTNLMVISLIIYGTYGIKVLYKMLRKKHKNRAYPKFLALLTVSLFPLLVFILGALNSFNIKIKLQKK